MKSKSIASFKDLTKIMIALCVTQSHLPAFAQTQSAVNQSSLKIVLDPRSFDTLQIQTKPNTLAFDDTGLLPNFGGKIIPPPSENRDSSTSPERSTPSPKPTPVPSANNNNNNNNNKITSLVKVADVGKEFSCPLFENRPYQTLTTAMQSLSTALVQVPDCKGEKDTVLNIEKNQQVIMKSIENMNAYMDPDIDLATVNASQISANAQAAVQGVKNIADIFSNKYFTNSSCGKNALSNGSILVSLSDVINSVAPFALLAAAVNPAMGGTVKLALMGTMFASSTVGAMSQLITDSLPKMDTSEQRKALLQNVCAYSKVYRQIEYITLAKSGRIKDIQEKLNSKSADFLAQKFTPSENLLRLLQTKEAEEQDLPRVVFQLRELRKLFGDLNSNIINNKNEMLVCMIGKGLIDNNEHSGQITSRAMGLINDTIKYSDTTSRFQLVGLAGTLEKLSMEVSKKSNSKNIKEISNCAKSTLNLSETITQAIAATKQVLDAKRKSIESKYMKNPEYNFFFTSLTNYRLEEANNRKLTKLLEELQKDDSAIDRSEMDITMNQLQNALFGSSKSIFNSSPVTAWLNKTISNHRMNLKIFNDGFTKLRDNAFAMTLTGKGEIYQIKGSHHINSQILSDTNSSVQLSTFNLINFPEGSRGHQLLCQDLKTTWRKLGAAIDHLSAAEFMCDMIDDVTDFTVENDIREFCIGNKSYSQANKKVDLLKTPNSFLSGLELVKKDLVIKNSKLSGQSYQSSSQLIVNKINELKCSMPDAKIMNGNLN